ncbi:site-specific DNA-methyltransferase [Microcoleus sp. Pol14C6]|uniref:site-specific DNA-methyltransferase n=1 Tax=unclassified Microcoleus TaxID=2642155 RepID=UPI002FD11D2D
MSLTELVDRIIKSASNLKEIVLDPFMGSGTTAIVSLGLQRQVIGFEIRADYCQIVASRINNFLMGKELREAQLSLF